MYVIPNFDGHTVLAQLVASIECLTANQHSIKTAAQELATAMLAIEPQPWASPR